MSAARQNYNDKNDKYFSGERRDFIDRLGPSDSRAILEIGCGNGATGAYAKRTEKCGRYVGIELFPEAARLAAKVLNEVHCADVETFNFPHPGESFDVLIASEVLEHLIDPWAVLKRLRSHLSPGALVFASSPNVAHHSVFRMLAAGRWDYEPRGRMDRTHLRWFTPSSYARMFSDCGYNVISVEPLVRPRVKARILNILTAGRLTHIFTSQIVVIART